MAHKDCRAIIQGGEIGDPFSVEVLGARASNGRVIVDDELGRVQRSPLNLSIGIPSRKGAFFLGGGDFMEVRFYNVNALWHNVQSALMKTFPNLWSQIVFSVGLLPDHAKRCVKSGCCEGAGKTCEPAVCVL